jgi:hypothetical protein
MSLTPKDLTCHTDEELFCLLKQNHKKALSILFDRYSYDLYLYIKSIILTRASGIQVQYETQKILLNVFASLPPALPVSLEHHLFDTAYYKAMNYICRHTVCSNAALHLN